MYEVCYCNICGAELPVVIFQFDDGSQATQFESCAHDGNGAVRFVRMSALGLSDAIDMVHDYDVISKRLGA